jgi:aminoglycoside phosphotransferase (APT) family kinase protein
VIGSVGTHCAVAVPAVIASNTDRETPYILTAPMDERSLIAQWSDLTADDCATAIRRIGAALAEVHTRSFERHSHIEGGDADGLVLKTGAWTDVLVDRIELMREIGSSDRFDHHFDEVTAAVEANRDLLDDAPATLVHGAPAQPNCFVGDAAVGFVDWELAHVGDPGRELHRARDQLLSRSGDHEQRLAEALQQGYRERAGSLTAGFENRTPVYDAVRQLGKSGFFDKHVELSGEPAERLAKRVDTDMKRRLERTR